MSNEFSRSTPALDAAIAACNSPEDIRELSKASLESQGIISRNVREDGQYGARLTGWHPEQAAQVAFLPAQPQATPTCSRVIYPHLNDRYELTGSSEDELDAKESRIRQIFGGQ